MTTPKTETLELTYPLRTVTRLTGLSPEVVRAWERRYGVVSPTRTAGGTRRYSAAEVERLRLVKAVVDAGHRVSEVAQLDVAELKRRSALTQVPDAGNLRALLAALETLDGAETQRLLALQLSTLGPARFSREVALPLLQEIGARWAQGRLGIAPEHLATSVLRSLLGAALQPTAVSVRGPRILFATPSGEPHELGLLMAAVTALGSGANPLLLGVDVPVEDLLEAAEAAGAAVLALGIVTVPPAQAARSIAALRHALPAEVRLWLGGAGASGLEVPAGVEYFESLEALEQRVALLASEVSS